MFYLDLIVATEAIELVEQLKHGPLHLPISRLLPPKSLRADRVQFVDEDDRPSLARNEDNTGQRAPSTSSYEKNLCDHLAHPFVHQ